MNVFVYVCVRARVCIVMPNVCVCNANVSECAL